MSLQMMTPDQSPFTPVEVTVLTNYIVHHLYSKLPRRRVDVFAEELSSSIQRKLMSLWNANPNAGVIRINVAPPLEIDSAVQEAIRSSGLNLEEVVQELPSGLSLTVEPGEVTCGSAYQGETKILYRRSSNGSDLSPVDASSPDLLQAESNFVDPNLTAMLSVRPANPASNQALPSAVFAQTKFGSTKLRTQTPNNGQPSTGGPRRPSRLNGASKTSPPTQPRSLHHQSLGLDQNGGVFAPQQRGPNVCSPTGMNSGSMTTRNAMSSVGTPMSTYWPVTPQSMTSPRSSMGYPGSMANGTSGFGKLPTTPLSGDASVFSSGLTMTAPGAMMMQQQQQQHQSQHNGMVGGMSNGFGKHQSDFGAYYELEGSLSTPSLTCNANDYLPTNFGTFGSDGNRRSFHDSAAPSSQPTSQLSSILCNTSLDSNGTTAWTEMLATSSASGSSSTSSESSTTSSVLGNTASSGLDLWSSNSTSGNNSIGYFGSDGNEQQGGSSMAYLNGTSAWMATRKNSGAGLSNGWDAVGIGMSLGARQTAPVGGEM